MKMTNLLSIVGVVCLTSGLYLGSMNTFAQTYTQSAEVSGSPIDINGYVVEAPVSDQELEQVKSELRKQNQTIIINKEKSKKYKELSRTTEKLADTTEEMIEERHEAQGEIEKYNKKIDCLLNKKDSPDCDEFVKNKSNPSSSHGSSNVSQKKIETPAEHLENEFQIIPLIGMSAISSKNENLESNMALGIRMESLVSPRFAVGVGFHYMSLTTNDYQDSFYFPGSFRPIYGAFYDVREISYTNMNLEFNGKYYFLSSEKFRPYLGGGLAYNRVTMNYQDNRPLNQNTNSFGAFNNGWNNYNWNSNYQFGNEEITTSYLSGRLASGAEVNFSKTFGLNMELSYIRSLGGNLSSSSRLNGFVAPDQVRLNDLNRELLNAHIFSFNIGMIIKF